MQHKKPAEPTLEQSTMIEDAVALHQSGQLDMAEILYNKLLKLLPCNTTILTNLGTITLQKGSLEYGLITIEKSLQINPHQPNALNNKGNALQDLNRLDEALVSYERAIAFKPEYAEAYCNRAATLQALNRPNEALASYDHALILKPDFAEAYSNRGTTLQDLKRPDEALTSCERAITINPDFAEAYFNRGNALKDLNRLDEAISSFEQAIFLKPYFAEAYSNLGNTLKDLNRLNEALAYYEHAIILNPFYADAYYNRGIALQSLNRLDEALTCYDRAIVLDPNYAKAYSNRGTALQDLNQLNEALASYENAIILKPDYAEVYWNKSLLKLLMGEYLEGWQLYEWGWKSFARKPLRNFDKPLWLGNESLRNKTVLIYPEQGLGDYIQYIRYAVLVEQLGATIILEVPLALMALFLTLKAQFTLVECGKPLPDFDYQCPIMSLPLAFKTTVETIPAQLPYLYADEKKKQQWQVKLGKKTVTRIGLVWSGSNIHKNDQKRSLLLKQFETFLNFPLEFHCLQNQIREIDVNTLTEFPHIHQHQDDLLDFSDTAALVDAMDIIISVDTSVAHLAGAMGKQVFILLPYAPDYRWLLDRVDSPWYPTAKLFRQAEMDNWEAVIIKISKILLTV